MWQAGSWGAQPKVIVQSVGAKGERVHYLSRQLLPLVRMSVDVSIARLQKYLLPALAKLGIKVIWATLTF